MQVSGNVFIVTGGASGLGEATVRSLSARGGRVVIADLNDARGELVAHQTSGRYAHCDVTSEDDAAAAVALASALGTVRGLVNCAGIGTAEKTLGRNGPHSMASFTKTIGVNLIGTFNMIRLAGAAIARAEPLPSGERGVVVNTASVAAFDGQIGQAAYSASKGGIVGMTLPIAREFASIGIRVVTIAPGLFKTPLLAGLPQDAQLSLGKQVPFPPRLGNPDEYAALVIHIVENEMLNGETIRLDGAIRMAPR
jgi:NAD(P)-dependent dehydrogenase (short-subunit alcohol dehydrogenase family)